MSSVTSQTSRQRPQPDHLEITNWPLRDDGLASVAVVALWLALTFAAGYASRSVGMTVFVSLTLVVTFWRFWLPVRYDIAAHGVTRKLLGWQRRISWGAVAAYRVHQRGLQLLPRDETAPLAFLQGWYIRWGSQREALVQLVAYYYERVALHSWSDSARSTPLRSSGSAPTLAARPTTVPTNDTEPSVVSDATEPARKPLPVDPGSTAPPDASPDAPPAVPPDDATVVRGRGKNE